MKQKGFAPILILVIVLIAGIGAAYYFGYDHGFEKSIKNPPIPIEDPKGCDKGYVYNNGACMKDETANKETFKSIEFGIEFRVPPEVTKHGKLKEYAHESSDAITARSVKISLTGQPCLYPNNSGSSFYIVSSTADFYALQGFNDGRGGSLCDYFTYEKKDNNYFINGSDLSSDKNLALEESTNKNGLTYLKIESLRETAGDGPTNANILYGQYVAIFNIKNSKYKGFGVSINKDELTKERFNLLLSTFKFTQ